MARKRSVLDYKRPRYRNRVYPFSRRVLNLQSSRWILPKDGKALPSRGQQFRQNHGRVLPRSCGHSELKVSIEMCPTTTAAWRRDELCMCSYANLFFINLGWILGWIMKEAHDCSGSCGLRTYQNWSIYTSFERLTLSSNQLSCSCRARAKIGKSDCPSEYAAWLRRSITQICTTSHFMRINELTSTGEQAL